MKVPGLWIEREEVESTQAATARLLADGEPVGILFARHQANGKGRFGRPWVSERGDSLTMSIAFEGYVGHPRPWLIGMATACACAEVLDCRLRWPNDLGMNGLKLGGILTELLPGSGGRSVPVVGVGINLNQASFPAPLDGIATSVLMQRGSAPSSESLAHQIIERLSLMPEPDTWDDLLPVWSAHDATPGKSYKLTSGEVAIARQVGAGGELLCTIDGEPKTVLAADAIFGANRL